MVMQQLSLVLARQNFLCVYVHQTSGRSLAKSDRKWENKKVFMQEMWIFSFIEALSP